jgi:hypothetical protein
MSQQSMMLAAQDASMTSLSGAAGAASYAGAAAGALYGYEKAGVAGAVGGGLVGYGATGMATSMLAGGSASAGLASTLGAIPGWGWVALAVLAILGGGKGSTPHIGTTKEFGLDGTSSFLNEKDPANTSIAGWMFGDQTKHGDNQQYQSTNTAIDALGKGLLDSMKAGVAGLGGEMADGFKFAVGFAADNDDASGGFSRVTVPGTYEGSDPISRILDKVGIELTGNKVMLDYFKRYSKSAEKGYTEMVDDIVPRITLLAYQTATGLRPAIDTLLDTVDATTASTKEITDLMTLAVAWQGIAGFAMADPVEQALEQINLAGRTALQTWQDGNVSLTAAMASFDGSLASAQSLGAATQAQYQMELSLIGQIQGLLQSTGGMFASSIRDIQMSVMSDSERYDFLRTEIDGLYSQLSTAFDPTIIGNLAQQINALTNQAYGMLGEDQRPGASAEFIGYLEDVNTLTTERLNASQAQIVEQHKAMAEVIEASMQKVADQMMAAAVAQREAAAISLAAAQQEQRISIDFLNFASEVGQG